MRKTLIYFAGISLLTGCSSNLQSINYREKPLQNHRHPYESEFRPGLMPYHEMMLQEKPEKKEKPLTPEEIERHPSLWERRLRGNVV